MADLPTGTVTLLFADIEGSTRLLQHLGDRYADVLAEYRRLLRVAAHSQGGREIGTQGDGCFVAFPRAKGALAAAVAAMRAIHRYPWPAGIALPVRMGLHTGEPLSADTGYVGLDVRRAASICVVGHGGQLLLSQTTRDLVADDLPKDISFRDLGPHRLKDLAGPQVLFQVVAVDLPTDFPPLHSLEAFPNNLPIQLTSFIGREREKGEVRRLLSTTRLLTLTGAGGSGKTRLALHVAADQLEQYSGGAWRVELAPLSDPTLVPRAVASALGISEQLGRPLAEVVADYLRPKSLLLVLDNCEHVLPACAQLADTLLRACPSLRILATSREALRIAGEISWRVPSLSLPDPQRLPHLQRLMEYEAVQLFIERAGAILPAFTLTAQNASAILRICDQLDGIPLAIELAAARVKVLSVDQIAARLDDRFRLLTGGSRTALPRHQTLRATMDWSYGLLSDQEQTVLRRLSVFAGGWTLEAAEAVCAGGEVEASDILDLLTQLVHKSLVIAETQAGEARYRLLETVRQYGRDRLQESKEREEILGRHLDFFLKLAEEIQPRLEGAEQAVWLHRLDAEHDNLREALAWSMHNAPEKGLRLAGVLGRFWMVRGHFTEGRGWLKKALERGVSGSAALRAKALNLAGWMAIRQHDYAAARSLLENSLAIYRELGDRQGIADSVLRLGVLSMNEADHTSARAFLEESLATYRQLGDKRGILAVLGDLGHEAWHQGDHASARPILEEAMVLARELGEVQAVGYALHSLGLVAFDQHNYGEAHSLFEEGLATAKALGDTYEAVSLVEHFAALIAEEGQYARAARLLGAAEAYRKAKGSPLPFAHRSDYDRPVATIRAGLAEEAFAAAWAEGAVMTMEQAVAYALTPAETVPLEAEAKAKPRIGKRADLLTPREREVAALVAGGLTNREIAERLVVSQRTTETHVQNILNKLGVTSRAEVAAWAVECGLYTPPPH